MLLLSVDSHYLSAVDLEETGTNDKVGFLELGAEQLEDITSYTALANFSRNITLNCNYY